MGLNQALRETTHRQSLLWRVWLTKRLNRPNRSDYYAMKIAQTVRQGVVKNPNRVKLDQFKLKFTTGRTKQDIATSKRAWIAGVGGKVRKVTRGPDNVNDNGT